MARVSERDIANCRPYSIRDTYEALELITRRQAWQFRVLPIRMDGRELVMATQDQVFLRGELEHDSPGVAILRHVGQPAIVALADAKARDVLAFDSDAARRRLAQTDDALL